MKDKWIEECMSDIKEMAESNPNMMTLSAPALKWIKSMLKMSWESGKSEGMVETYANARELIGK